MVVGKNADGKRIVKSFTADTALASEKMAMDFVTRYGVGKTFYEMTVAGAITQYINSRTNTVSPVTIRTYESIRDTRLQSIMDKKIVELTVPDVQMAVNVDAARLTGKTISAALSLVQAALSFQGIDTNFKKHVTIPKNRTKKKFLPPPAVIIGTIRGTKYELGCLLAMWLSLRISEVRGLQYGDISKDGKWLSVQRSVVYANGVDYHNDFNKTEGSTRTVRLPKYLYEMIMSQPHNSDTDPIVPLGYNCLYKGFRNLMAAQGYDMIFHDLRAVFATTLKSLHIPDDYVQQLGGWSNPTTMIISLTRSFVNRFPPFFLYPAKVW